jgi:hypothetical protein
MKFHRTPVTVVPTSSVRPVRLNTDMAVVAATREMPFNVRPDIRVIKRRNLGKLINVTLKYYQ